MLLNEAQKILDKEIFDYEEIFDQKCVKNFKYGFMRSLPNGVSGLFIHFYYLEEGIYYTRNIGTELEYVGDSEEILCELLIEKEKLESKNPVDYYSLNAINELLDMFRLEVLFLSQTEKGIK
jgi:hypothetical protein